MTWRYFEHGYCFLRFFEGYTFDDANIVAADDPDVGFFASARAGALPSVSFIDPHFIEYPPDANCDGPPADVTEGQDFIQRVVEAVVAGPGLGEDTAARSSTTSTAASSTTCRRRPPCRSHPTFRSGRSACAFRLSSSRHGSARALCSATTPPLLRRRRRRTPKWRRHTATDAALHFDHTSILKTIARRFLSADPPYMGARFAAAQDLSSVIGTQLRHPQFRPFIRYRLEYIESAMMLDVQFANRAAGTMLWQFPANGTVAQDFSFEDAGDGFVYIRSYVSNLYVTVQIPDPVVTLDGSPAPEAMLGLIQDAKYAPSDVELPEKGPALQRWSADPGVDHRPRPRPVRHLEQGPSGFGAAASKPDAGRGAGRARRARDQHRNPPSQKAWKVTSPLLSDEIVPSQ